MRILQAADTPEGAGRPRQVARCRQAAWARRQARRLRRDDPDRAGWVDRPGIGLERDTDAAKHPVAEVLALANRPQEATEALEQALERYERKGNLVSAQRGQTRLAELRAA